MLKMLGLTYYNIKMLKNDFFSSLLGKGRGTAGCNGRGMPDEFIVKS